MKSKSFYITIFSSLLNLSMAFVIFISTIGLSSSVIQNCFSIVWIIYFLWIAVKNFRERNLPHTFTYKKLFAALGLMFLLAGTLIFAASTLQNKPPTATQKERLIIK